MLEGVVTYSKLNVISVACVSSETHNLQRVSRRTQDRRIIVPGVPCEDRRNWD